MVKINSLKIGSVRLNSALETPLCSTSIKKTQAAVGEYDELLTLVKKRKLRWFGHVSRSSSSAETILQGKVERKRGRQEKRWENNSKEWTGIELPAQLG